MIFLSEVAAISVVLQNPTGPETLLMKHGHGIYLMRAVMDDVSFEEGGTVVTMRKKSNVSPTEERKPPNHVATFKINCNFSSRTARRLADLKH